MPSGFPTLQPAFTVRVNIDAPMAVGGQAGSQLVIVPMVSGTVKSEDGFEPKFNGELYVVECKKFIVGVVVNTHPDTA